MDYDISQPVPQGSNGAQDAENSRIAAIANELERLCTIHEAQSGDSQQNVSRFETEQRAAELHNILFPDTAYSFYGFAGFDGRTIQPVIVQPRIADAHPATKIQIDTYMAALGFEKTTQDGCFRNSQYEVWDVLPRNVLVDDEGDIFVVDAEIKHITSSIT